MVEQTGAIRIVKDGSLLSTPFIDLSRSVSSGGEQGLLGLAFHPSYRTNGKLYVSYTDRTGTSVIREYRVSGDDPDRVDTRTGRTLLRVKQPYANHNGGHIAFGPDGLLYIGLGDGGSGGDPGNRAQSRTTLLGKLLRIDVNRRTGSLRVRHPVDQPVRRPERARPDLGVRPAQPVGLLVRPGDGRPVDRRRRPGRVGGGRSGPGGSRPQCGSRPELRLAGDGGRALLPAGRAAARGPARPCRSPSTGTRRRSLLDHRRPRLPWQGVSGPGRRLPVRRLLLRARSGTSIAAPRAGSRRRRALDTNASITGFGEDQAGELYLTDAGGTLYRVTDS